MTKLQLRKGDKVVMHTCIEAETHDGKVWTCRSDEFKHHPNHDYTSIMLEGFSGSFQTEFLQKIDIESIDKSSDEVVVLSKSEYEILLSHKKRVTSLQEKLHDEKKKNKKLRNLVEEKRTVKDTQFY